MQDHDPSSAANGPVPLRPGNGGDFDAHQQPIAFVELLFFAYRDFVSEPDAILAEFGFGRAHHRVLHFVSRHPGMRVADLLEILKITKQSLAPVLRELIRGGYVEQHAGTTDRRERLLYSTADGQSLARRLAAPQIERVRDALNASGADAEKLVEAFLSTMVSESERQRVSDLIAAGLARSLAGQNSP